MMTDEMNQDDVQQPTLKPSLTGDLMLDNALERLRRTLDARAKKEAAKQLEPANRHDTAEMKLARVAAQYRQGCR
jgi:hypothetical protein